MKKMKQVLALMLCTFALLGSVPVASASEAAESVLSIETVGGRRGEVVTVDVTLNEVNGIAGGKFDICYDNTLLALESAQAGSVILGRAVINEHYADNKVRVSFAGFNELNSAGTLLTLTFQISESAPLGDIVLTAENVKFFDVNSEVVSRAWEAGAVQVQSVTIAIGSESCLPGQAVSLPVTLGGALAPSGGEFEIHYNTRMLTGASVKGEDKMGDVGINLSYNIFPEDGYVKVSWAAVEPISELGQLCTVVFAVDETAAGDTAVTIDNVKFYDEDSKKMDYNEPESGTVTVVTSYNENPILYVVGGQLAEDGSSATVQIAIDGAGLVCGGTFQLSYDTTLCQLTGMKVVKDCVATNPEDVASVNANGGLKASWAEDRAALDNETILELEFKLLSNVSVPLVLENAVLKDKNGLTMEGTQIHSGHIGIKADVQAPITEIQNTEEAVYVNTTLYDAQFCGDEKTEGASFILAGYADGKMQSASIPAESVTFDHNGIAQINLELPFGDDVDQVNLFVLDAEGGMRPLSENAQINIG